MVVGGGTVGQGDVFHDAEGAAERFEVAVGFVGVGLDDGSEMFSESLFSAEVLHENCVRSCDNLKKSKMQIK